MDLGNQVELLDSAGTVIARHHPNQQPRAGNHMSSTAEISYSFQTAPTPYFVNTTTNFAPRAYTGPETIFLDPEKTRDIHEYYSVENELGFLDRYGTRLNQEEQFFYLIENQLKFLGEFVGKLKFSKIRYLLNEKNGFNFAGLRLIDMLKHTTSLAGNESREGFENTGLVKLFKKFEEDLLSGNNQLQNGLLLSPPKDWNYGFAFYYEKQYDPFLGEFVINMYPLRYVEEKHQLVQSQKILSSVRDDATNYQTTEDYLAQPLLDAVPSLDKMLTFTNITANDINQLDQFQSIMEEHLGAEISLYAQGIIYLYQHRNNISEKELGDKYVFLETLRRSIFNQAKDVWENKPQLRKHYDKFEPVSSHPIIDQFPLSQQLPVINMERVLFYGTQMPAVIVGGGSCPVTQKSTSISSLAENVMNGNSIESMTQNNFSDSGSDKSDEFGSLTFECPDCKKVNERPRHQLLPACQHCGSTKVCAPKKSM